MAPKKHLKSHWNEIINSAPEHVYIAHIYRFKEFQKAYQRKFHGCKPPITDTIKVSSIKTVEQIVHYVKPHLLMSPWKGTVFPLSMCPPEFLSLMKWSMLWCEYDMGQLQTMKATRRHARTTTTDIIHLVKCMVSTAAAPTRHPAASTVWS